MILETSPVLGPGEKDTASSDLAGKVILITGGTSGLGAASAMALAQQTPGPARIYISGRHASAAAKVIQQIRTATSTSTDIVFLPCDLTDLSSVALAAKTVLANEDRLDVVMANAGIAAVPAGLSKDGYEVQFATNHLGHALLVRKLLPLLEQSGAETGTPSRVVWVTSFAFRGAMRGIPLARIRAAKSAGPQPRGYYLSSCEWCMCPAVVGRWMRYAESKLANVLYARELATRFPGVASVSVCPGFVETDMVASMGFCDRLGTRVLAMLVPGGDGMVTPDKGARNQVWAATVAPHALSTGALYETAGVAAALSGRAADETLGTELWEWTERELDLWL
ncbi:oxidoreductase [Podospora appendiculata]|uniref:Oxidoreductase n=1 Tax=Podospora appendiculata TaxID=314037 RepID=A0AAE0XD24_9PEZI|nr:oxidoreductase [Podospora appendiculata]